MTIWLALDIGDRRIGLATGNDSAWLARPLGILTRRSKREDFSAIARRAEEVQADCILVGLPYNMDGSEGPQAKRVRNYATRLEYTVELPVTYWDERLSSFEADQIIAQQGRKRSQKHNDDIAAAAILQTYLNQLRK
ncbi:MAG: Holliday junction resolvase RuvX [Chloroflexi bacterium]|nr:Holliday junction resolvase RuvX [Chloroflexota bacterium]